MSVANWHTPYMVKKVQGEGEPEYAQRVRTAVVEAAKAGRSYAAIAKAAGIHAVTLSRFLYGHRALSGAAIERLARAVGYSIRVMLLDYEPPPSPPLEDKKGKGKP